MTERRRGGEELAEAVKSLDGTTARVVAVMEAHSDKLDEMRDRLQDHDERQVRTGEAVAGIAALQQRMADDVTRIGIKTDELGERLAKVEVSSESSRKQNKDQYNRITELEKGPKEAGSKPVVYAKALVMVIGGVALLLTIEGFFQTRGVDPAKSTGELIDKVIKPQS